MIIIMGLCLSVSPAYSQCSNWANAWAAETAPLWASRVRVTGTCADRGKVVGGHGLDVLAELAAGVVRLDGGDVHMASACGVCSPRQNPQVGKDDVVVVLDVNRRAGHGGWGTVRRPGAAANTQPPPCRPATPPARPPGPTAPAAHILKLQVGEYDFSYARPSDLSASADNLAVGTAVILAKEDAALLGVPYCGRTERLAISNTHCVEDIGPRRKAKAKTHLGVKVDIAVVCIVPLFDFCILRCSLDAIPPAQRDAFTGLRCLTQRHEMPCPGTPVTAHGYALDSETVHTTQGIVTSASGSHLPGFLSHSASIASGNSGGPLVESASGKLVGLNTATLVESEAIALAVPCWVVFATIRQQGADRGVAAGYPGFATKPRCPSDARRNQRGARHPGAGRCRFDVLQGDVITAIADHAIGPGGKLGGAGSEVLTALRVLDEPTCPVSAARVQLAMAQDDDGTIELTVERPGCRNPVTVVGDPVQPTPSPCGGTRRLYPFHEPVPHLSVGGLVLQNLTVGLLEAFDVDASTAQERDCLGTCIRRASTRPTGAQSSSAAAA